jgi:DNA repair photolyase
MKNKIKKKKSGTVKRTDPGMQIGGNELRKIITGIWQKTPVEIKENNFVHKSLCFCAVNLAVGCAHGCRFCYVPETSTIKLAGPLAQLGVGDPDADWGNYVFLRRWDEGHFLKSLAKAELMEIPPGHDGNRAVMFCTTTDPYPVVAGASEECKAARSLLRHALVLIRDHSTLRVRILTRSPLAKLDFELFKSFGNRLQLGMSIPTLNDTLAKIYEPYAPSVAARLAAITAAKKAGLNVFVALAPTYAECDEADLRRTLQAMKELDLVTIFHEPINIRAENVRRIAEHATTVDFPVNTTVFDTAETTMRYGLEQLLLVQCIARELGIEEKLKLWPDTALKPKSKFMKIRQEEPPATKCGERFNYCIPNLFLRWKDAVESIVESRK